MKKTKVLAVALAVLTMITAACGPFHMGSRERAVVIFTNESLDQADVYATIGATTPVRIGTVLANRTDTLFVPNDVTDRGGTFSIVARVFTRNLQPSTGPITLRSGDQIRVRLPVDARILIVTP